MSEINVVVISCKIESDPEVCVFQNGSKVFQCRVIGPGTPYKDDVSGTWRRRPVWIDLKAWNRGNALLADLCERRLVKGSKILLTGILATDEWTDAKGVKKSRVIIEVKEIEFLD